MNIQNKLLIWVSEENHLIQIEKIKFEFEKMGVRFDDIFLTSNNDIKSANYANIDQFYINFDNIYVVFLNLEDLIKNKSNLQSEHLYVCASTEQIISSKLDKQFFKNVRTIEI